MCSFWALATWSATTHCSQLTCAHVGLGSRQLCVEISCCRCWWCGSSTLGVWSRTPGGGLLGPVARCLNCGSYEHGILIISLENLAPPTAVLCFFFFSLQLALGGFNFVFRGILANIRQTFSLFAFFGCQRESVKTNDCTSLQYAMENAVACLLCSQFSPYLVLDVTLSTALSTHRKRAFLEIHRPSCLACSGSFVCSHCLLICGETDTGTDTDALEWSRLASELLKRGSVQWSSVRSSIRHSFSQLPGLFSNATACLPMQRANKA